ncbi:MAG: leucine-rich repeat domain-containing protein [Ruminococcaceae bacterium]|nr:leucine-rich repeat domain-containing protein [Oscillospiraceae bacterium]
MKKRILFALTLAVMLVCAFALSVGAEHNKSEVVSVSLSDGSSIDCALYDSEGDALVWYTLDEGATVTSVKTKELFNNTTGGKLVEATYLGDIYLDASTLLQKHNESTTNKIVVANLRECTFKTIDHAGYRATFSDSKVVQYVYLPNTFTNMGCNVFQNCTNLKVCDIPSDASFIISSANNFVGCTSLIEINLLGCTAVTGSIIHSHFSGCTSLTKVIINPETIDWKSIGGYSFGSCPLTQFGLIEGECTIPATTTYIGNAGFQNSRFTKVVMSDSITSLGWNVFASNPNLTEAYISSGLETSDIRVFYGCTSLATVTGLEGCKLTSIPTEYFMNTAVTSIVLPSTCTTVGFRAFNGCGSLLSVTIPEGFVLIDDYAFQNCKKLETCTFLGNAGENAVIDQAAFENCYELRDVNIPYGVTTLGNCAYKSAGTKDLTLPGTLTTLNGGSHFHGSALETVTGLENTQITVIPDSMFRSQSKWNDKVVRLPDTVTSIGQYGMADCAFEVLILSPNMTTIGIEAFVNCCSIREVYIPDTVTTIKNNAFRNNLVNDILFFVTSNDSEYIETIKTGTGTTNAVISLADYEADKDSYLKGRYVIYGCNVCDAFYDGKHQMSGDYTIQKGNYFESVTFADTCTREACGLDVIDNSKTIGAVFSYLGFSYTEAPVGGTYSMAQFFGVNEENLAKYEELMGTTLSFGVIAQANKLEAGQETVGTIKPTMGVGKVLYKDFTNGKHNYFEIKVSGISEALKDTKIVFCAYVIENGKMSYLNNNATVEELTGESYKDVVAIKNAK